MASSGSDEPAGGTAPPKSKAALASPIGRRKPVCRYGKACYNNSPAHLFEYAHPWLDAKTDDKAKDHRKVCKYGKDCYNKKPEHLAQYAHPWLEEEGGEKEAPTPPRARSTSPRTRSPPSRDIIRRLSTPPRKNEVNIEGQVSLSPRSASRSPPPTSQRKADAPPEEEPAAPKAESTEAAPKPESSEASPLIASLEPVSPSIAPKDESHREASHAYDAEDEQPALSEMPKTSSDNISTVLLGEGSTLPPGILEFTPVPPGAVSTGAASSTEMKDLHAFSEALDDLEAQTSVKEALPGAMSSPEADLPVAESSRAPAKPKCRYGKDCYRKDPEHFKLFDHSEGVASKAASSQSPTVESVAAEAEAAPVGAPPAPFEPTSWAEKRESVESHKRSFLASFMQHRATAALRPKSLPRTTLQVSVLSLWATNFVLVCVVLYEMGV